MGKKTKKFLGKVGAVVAPIAAVGTDLVLKKSGVSKDTPVVSDASKQAQKAYVQKPLSNPTIAAGATIAVGATAGPAAGAGVAALAGKVQADEAIKKAESFQKDLLDDQASFFDDSVTKLGEAIPDPVADDMEDDLTRARRRKRQVASGTTRTLIGGGGTASVSRPVLLGG